MSRSLLFLALALCLGVASAAQAKANHILVASEAKCNEIKSKIDAAPDKFKAFEEFARSDSTCPSGRSGGALGSFGPGQMVKEFDDVIFKSGTVGKVEGCVKTQFGYHLIYITERA